MEINLIFTSVIIFAGMVHDIENLTSPRARVVGSWVPWLLVTVTRWEDTGGLDLFQDSNGRPVPQPRRQNGFGIPTPPQRHPKHQGRRGRGPRAVARLTCPRVEATADASGPTDHRNEADCAPEGSSNRASIPDACQTRTGKRTGSRLQNDEIPSPMIAQCCTPVRFAPPTGWRCVCARLVTGADRPATTKSSHHEVEQLMAKQRSHSVVSDILLVQVRVNEIQADGGDLQHHQASGEAACSPR